MGQRWKRGAYGALPDVVSSQPLDDSATGRTLQPDGTPCLLLQPHLDRRLQAEDVVGDTFVEINDALVTAKVTAPGGEITDVPLQWTGERNGQYRGTFVSSAQGMYTTAVEAIREGKSLGKAQTHVRAAPGDAEYFDATMHGARLKRIADETGGRFYTPETMASLPEDLKYTGRGVTTVEERDLWHMPIVLLLLLALICAEWGYRRAVGMA